MKIKEDEIYLSFDDKMYWDVNDFRTAAFFAKQLSVAVATQIKLPT